MVTCGNCGKTGHNKRSCPELKAKAANAASPSAVASTPPPVPVAVATDIPAPELVEAAAPKTESQVYLLHWKLRIMAETWICLTRWFLNLRWGSLNSATCRQGAPPYAVPFVEFVLASAFVAMFVLLGTLIVRLNLCMQRILLLQADFPSHMFLAPIGYAFKFV
jgi:hypothetical protein